MSFSYSIKVSNLDKSISWEKELSRDEFHNIYSSVKGARTVSLIPATLFPVRTDNLKGFKQDFFFPTLVNHALTIKSTVPKFFAVLGALPLDCLTFPIRLLTCFPRLLSNNFRKGSQLKLYLHGHKMDPRLVALDKVTVILDWETDTQVPAKRMENGKVKHWLRPVHERHWRIENVNFIQVPTYKGHKLKEQTSVEVEDFQ